ncbi:hypothetical protein [Thiobacillus sp.]
MPVSSAGRQSHRGQSWLGRGKGEDTLPNDSVEEQRKRGNAYFMVVSAVLIGYSNSLFLWACALLFRNAYLLSILLPLALFNNGIFVTTLAKWE